MWVKLKNGEIREVISYGGYNYIHLKPVDKKLQEKYIKNKEFSKGLDNVHESFVVRFGKTRKEVLK